MGRFEVMTLVVMERLVKYHPDIFYCLTCVLEAGQGTVRDGQFDWGGRLPNCTGGVRRFAQAGRKSAGECNGKSKPDCKRDTSSRDESRS